MQENARARQFGFSAAELDRARKNMSAGYPVNLRLLAAFRFLLVPLVRILLRNGISFNEISEVLKGAYARVAATDFAVPGRPMSYSRLSITTGIARRDFERVLGEEDRLRRALESNASRIANVLQGWHNDPEYMPRAEMARNCECLIVSSMVCRRQVILPRY